MPSINLQPYKMEIGDTTNLVNNLNDSIDILEASVNSLLAGYSAGFDMQGFHDASTAAYPAAPSQGDAWVIDTAGTISAVAYIVGDIILYDGSAWLKNPGLSGALNATDGSFAGQLIVNSALGQSLSLDINLRDNSAQAVVMEQGSNKYFEIVTSNASEAINFGSATINPDYNFLGSGDATFTGSISGAAGIFSGSVEIAGSVTSNNNTGQLNIIGGLDGNSASAVLYGTAHASKANDIELKDGSTIVLGYDKSADKISILKNTIIGSTSVTPDGTLHVHTSAVTGFSPSTVADDLTIEVNASGGSTVGVPDSFTGTYAIGSPSNDRGMYWNWAYSSGVGNIVVDKVGAKIDFYADATVKNLTLSGASGSELTAAIKDISFGGSVYGTNAAGPTVLNEAATSTNATLIPNKTDLATGMGWVSSGVGALIASNFQILQWSASGVVSIVDFSILSGDFTVTAGDASIPSGFLNFGTPVELTIASGVITASQSNHTIDTEADAATDDLNTINGGTAGDLLFLSSAGSARDTTVKDGVSNIALNGDFIFSSAADSLVLKFDGAVWVEQSRSDNQ